MDFGEDQAPTTSDRYGEALAIAQRSARAMYGGWQPAERDDLVQNVMHRLFTRFERQGWPENLDAYLRQTIRNTAINMADHDGRRPAAAIEPGPTYEEADDIVAAFLNEVRQTPSVLAAEQEAVDRALSLLDERDAKLFRLKFIDNVPTQMIATELGLHPDTVSRQAHRARRRLAEALGDHPDILDGLALVIRR